MSIVDTFFPFAAQKAFASLLTEAMTEAETPPPTFAEFFEITNLLSVRGTTPELKHPDKKMVTTTEIKIFIRIKLPLLVYVYCGLVIMIFHSSTSD